MKNDLLRSLAEKASDNYESARNDIDKVKSALELNRRGQLPLSEIQTDQERWNNRVARAGTGALERVNGTVDFQEIETIAKLMHLSESVCKINVRTRYNSNGSGTGFLIAPDLIITNNHVLPDPESAAYSTAQFSYELDALGNPKPTSTFRLEPDRFFMTSSYEKVESDSNSGLDFSIIAISENSIEGKSISDFKYSRLDSKVGKIVDGEGCVIIQHPQGDYKKIVLKDIRALICKDDFLIYESDTLPGSSGSMVIGLGTGEVVALHHSGVPRKNRHGQWLRKDGSVAQVGDADDLIDWIGNEGIRISRILKAVGLISLPEHMHSHRDQLLSPHPIEQQHSESNSIPMANSRITSLTANNTQFSDAQIWSFELELSQVENMQEDWRLNASDLIPGLVSMEPLYPLSTDASHRRFYYVKINTDENPWEIAGRLEALPQISTCTPDLAMLTDIRVGHYQRWNNGQKSFESFNDGTASWEESESSFKTKWIYAKWVKDHIRESDADAYRKWNLEAVNFKYTLLDDLPDLNKIDIVQLDTGYSHHAKVEGNYNLLEDEDFIDGSDANDEFNQGVLRHPGHGTRTASIVIGRAESDKIANNGNVGLLFSPKYGLLAKIIPYRVAQSVVLIGRGRNLFDAALHAIDSGADVIFLCMGSYPRPMLYSIAKTAYDRGVIWVCAAGNEVESVVAPAMYPGTIAVAATNPDDKPWKGSSYGDAVDIAAPGEDVYVPFKDKRGKDIMVFGNGTSYATPHVASAAAMWKAKHYVDLADIEEPWRIVERFRNCLRLSASGAKGNNLDQEENEMQVSGWDVKYGAGILNVKALLDDKIYELAKQNEVYAYENVESAPQWDLGVRELVHFLWGTVRRKLTPGIENHTTAADLTNRAKISLAAMSQNEKQGALEASGNVSDDRAEELIQTYFESFAKSGGGA